ncbi:MAG: Response regulator MprA [Planctomycetota bacterium]|jgi:CheY-like chemotaxis protein
MGSPDHPRVLVVGESATESSVSPACEVVKADDFSAALGRLESETWDGLLVNPDSFGQIARLRSLLQNEHILDGMPDGVVVIDVDNRVLWANKQFRLWTGSGDVVGLSFYSVLNSPEILGPDFCPFHTALATGQPSGSTLRTGDNRYFHIHAAPAGERAAPGQGGGKVPAGGGRELIVTVRDVTAEMLQQQKMAAIHKAGTHLADLTPEEVFQMRVDDRIELLKSNIVHYTQDLLKFDVVEIRLLDQATGALTPLLSVGLDREASERHLFARPQNNGVTGFVAATGKSYLCEDTTDDPLYLQGFAGAKSSLTVPLIFHDQVIGTFNVESPMTRAFTESDLQFLEIFSRDVAAALNTLELLVAQKANTAQESVEAIYRGVALPIDEILNDTVNVIERYIGHETQVSDRLQRILRNARDIRQVIQRVGQKITPVQSSMPHVVEHPKLVNRRILVVDADESVRNDAHAILQRYHCIVETAHDGDDAIFMVRNCGPAGGYDAIISDIRLPDMRGHELMFKLKELSDVVPLILMTGFGYDPGHAIVKSRQAGLHPKAVLYKPFRLDQLLETVETIIEWSQSQVPSA